LTSTSTSRASTPRRAAENNRVIMRTAVDFRNLSDQGKS